MDSFTKGPWYDGRINKWVREAMAARGVSYGMVADVSGVSKAVIHRIASGMTQRPDEETTRRLAEYFKIDPNYLLVMTGRDRYNTTQGGARPEVSLPEGYNVVLVPVFAQRAGLGVGKEVMQDYAEVVINQAIRRAQDLIGIKAEGDSMVPIVNDGELAVVDRGRSWKVGDIVLCMVDDVLYIKRVYPDGNGVKLTSASDAYAPIYAPETAIIGTVISVTRPLV